jgi:hypothetical protein
VKYFVKSFLVIYLFAFTIGIGAERTIKNHTDTGWCLHQKTTHNGTVVSNSTTNLNVSEKALRNAVTRLKKLYDTQKATFRELTAKCVSTGQPLSPKGLGTLQEYHIANKNGEIYDCYKKLVPLVTKIISINPAKSKFINFDELVKTGAITKK